MFACSDEGWSWGRFAWAQLVELWWEQLTTAGLQAEPDSLNDTRVTAVSECRVMSMLGEPCAIQVWKTRSWVIGTSSSG